MELIRRLGFVNAALFTLDRALERATGGRARLHKYYFMAQPVPREPLPVARTGGIAVVELHAGDARIPALDRPEAEIARRFEAGARCFAAWQGETLTGFLWFTPREYAEDEVKCTFRVHPQDRAVWDLDVHIVPRYRLGRTFALLWEHAFAAMRAMGARWTISRVSASNADSLRAHQRLGARCTGWAVFLLFGAYQLMLTSHGLLKCRRLEHGPYPPLVIRAPAEGPDADGTPAERGALAGAPAAVDQRPEIRA